MMTEIEQARHVRERGDILRTLKEDYLAEMTSVGSLARALDAQGISLSPEGLEFHLIYLEQQEYLWIWRMRDLPQARRDRRPRVKLDAIMFTKLRPKGLQLIDGQIPEDPLVAF
jgi:hypothetical protein